MKEVLGQHQEHVNWYAKVWFFTLVGAAILFCGSVILFVL